MPVPPAQGSPAARPRRVDLHCHSSASTEADEAVLTAIKCPESFSAPQEVYAQAKKRGMDFVTVTDHDSIEGVITLAGNPDVLIGEELTCYFPEDHCKMHVLVWGITRADHDALQAVAEDIYQVAAYIAEKQIAHSVAHPVYRQNDLLERWHLERLILLFKGFECLNGAHSVLHRQAFEPLLDELTPEGIALLGKKHGIVPLWPQSWNKARTGGSDDHGLFNIGRTWTEFPAEVQTPDDVLNYLRQGNCQPGGEAGSSLKLAHNFYSVGIRYFGRRLRPEKSRPTLTDTLLQVLVGERRTLSKRQLVTLAIRNRIGGVMKRISRPFRHGRESASGTALLRDLFLSSFKSRATGNGELRQALRDGNAPLGEHAAMFGLVSALNRDIAQGLAGALEGWLGQGELGSVCDSLSTVAGHQFLLLPYYFALFHQNRERQLLPQITGHGRSLDGSSLRLGVFTDVFDQDCDTSCCVREMARDATASGRLLTVHTSCVDPKIDAPYRKNFQPLVSRPMPLDASMELALPPITEILDWADRQQFDAIHVDTCGPMGLCGWLVAKMLRVPLLGTYHADIPAVIKSLTGDHRLTTAAGGYTKWFYGQMEAVLCKSRSAESTLHGLGLAPRKVTMLQPRVDGEKFTPTRRNDSNRDVLKIEEPYRIVYRGRINQEKNMPLLAKAFEQLRKMRSDAALVVIGDGPYLPEMRVRLAGLPAYFIKECDDTAAAAIYAVADLFVFPSATDTMAQAAIDAQASGLPVLVSDRGGAREVMDDGLSGLVLPAANPAAWAKAMNDLLNDEPRRLRMSRTAPQRMARYATCRGFDAYWQEHVMAARAAERRHAADRPAEYGRDFSPAPAMAAS